MKWKWKCQFDRKFIQRGKTKHNFPIMIHHANFLECDTILSSIKQIDSRAAIYGTRAASTKFQLKNKKKPIVYYCFELTSAPTAESNNAWLIFRRYSDFTTLMSDLSSLMPNSLVAFPTLPKKNSWSLSLGSTNRSPQRIAARREALRDWLNKITLHCINYQHDIPQAAQVAIVQFLTLNRNIVPGNITTEEVLRSLPHHHHLLEYTNERQDHHDDATTLSLDYDEGGDVDAEESYRDQEERLRDTTEDQRVLENVASSLRDDVMNVNDELQKYLTQMVRHTNRNECMHWCNYIFIEQY